MSSSFTTKGVGECWTPATLSETVASTHDSAFSLHNHEWPRLPTVKAADFNSYLYEYSELAFPKPSYQEWRSLGSHYWNLEPRLMSYAAVVRQHLFRRDILGRISQSLPEELQIAIFSQLCAISQCELGVHPDDERISEVIETWLAGDPSEDLNRVAHLAFRETLSYAPENCEDWLFRGIDIDWTSLPDDISLTALGHNIVNLQVNVDLFNVVSAFEDTAQSEISWGIEATPFHRRLHEIQQDNQQNSQLAMRLPRLQAIEVNLIVFPDESNFLEALQDAVTGERKGLLQHFLSSLCSLTSSKPMPRIYVQVRTWNYDHGSDNDEVEWGEGYGVHVSRRLDRNRPVEELTSELVELMEEMHEHTTLREEFEKKQKNRVISDDLEGELEVDGSED